MVKEEKINGKAYYQCEECDFYYKTQDLAQQCENFCNKHHSCSLELTKHAINPKKEKTHTCDINCKNNHGNCACC